MNLMKINTNAKSMKRKILRFSVFIRFNVIYKDEKKLRRSDIICENIVLYILSARCLLNSL